MPSPSARRTSIAIDRTHTSASSSWPSTARSRGRSRTRCGRGTMSRISKGMAIVIAVLATALYADEDRFDLKYSRTFTYRGGRVSVDHSFGSLVVETGSGSVVNVRATIRASDPDFVKEIDIT